MLRAIETFSVFHWDNLTKLYLQGSNTEQYIHEYITRWVCEHGSVSGSWASCLAGEQRTVCYRLLLVGQPRSLAIVYTVYLSPAPPPPPILFLRSPCPHVIKFTYMGPARDQTGSPNKNTWLGDRGAILGRFIRRLHSCNYRARRLYGKLIEVTTMNWL